MEKKNQHNLKVTQKGTLIIPKRVVKEIGANPGEFVKYQDGILRRAGMTRRGFIDLLLLGGGAAIGFLANSIQIGTFFSDSNRRAAETDQQLLRQLFGTMDNARIALVPARNHPFKILADNDPVYPIEAECCRSYLDRFTESYKEKPVRRLPNIFPASNVVLFGSQMSNLITREQLGDPFTEEPCSSVTIEEMGLIKGYVPLRWNFMVDSKSPEMIRRQFGLDWPFHDHIFYDFRDRCCISIGDREHEDHLLVTSIPRRSDGNLRVIIFSGLHGPGTLGSSLLLNEPPLVELQLLSKLIEKNPFFQAIFRVSTEKNSKTGELEPISIRLMDAQPLFCQQET